MSLNTASPADPSQRKSIAEFAGPLFNLLLANGCVVAYYNARRGRLAWAAMGLAASMMRLVVYVIIVVAASVTGSGHRHTRSLRSFRRTGGADWSTRANEPEYGCGLHRQQYTDAKFEFGQRGRRLPLLRAGLQRQWNAKHGLRAGQRRRGGVGRTLEARG